MKKTAYIALIFLISNSLFAQSSNSSSNLSQPEIQPIEVLGLKDPEWKSYRTMLKGIQAFHEHQSFAPNSELQFILRAHSSDVSLKGIMLRIASDKQSLSIPVSEEGIFSLPELALDSDENPDIVLRASNKMGTGRVMHCVVSANR